MEKTYHIETCVKAWLSCEKLLNQLNKNDISFAKSTLSILDECAYICMGTFHAIKMGIKNLNDMALLCVGVCEECAEICEKYSDEVFADCAVACRQCSTAIAGILKTSA